MQQTSYRYTPSSHLLDNPLLQAVAHGLAQLMPVTECETWPQPLLELLARLEDPQGGDTEAPPLVMVVGRCATMVEQAATLLRASELEVICCAGGEVAVAMMKSCAGDVALVVADQWLDGPMDGFGLARAFGLLWPGVPVILATEAYPCEPLPIAVTPLQKPWLPLSLLVEAHRVLSATPPLAS